MPGKPRPLSPLSISKYLRLLGPSLAQVKDLSWIEIPQEGLDDLSALQGTRGGSQGWWAEVAAGRVGGGRGGEVEAQEMAVALWLWLWEAARGEGWRQNQNSSASLGKRDGAGACHGTREQWLGRGGVPS